jgi:hypothetical protein
MHVSLPHDALLLLIITAAVVAIVLGWRVIVYLERRDRLHREIISGMRDQEGFYQEYQDGSSSYVRWPMTVAAGRDRQGAPRPSRPRTRRPDKAGHGEVVLLDRDRHEHAVRPEDSGAGDEAGRAGAAGGRRRRQQG